MMKKMRVKRNAPAEAKPAAAAVVEAKPAAGLAAGSVVDHLSDDLSQAQAKTIRGSIEGEKLDETEKTTESLTLAQPPSPPMAEAPPSPPTEPTAQSGKAPPQKKPWSYQSMLKGIGSLWIERGAGAGRGWTDDNAGKPGGRATPGGDGRSPPAIGGPGLGHGNGRIPGWPDAHRSVGREQVPLDFVGDCNRDAGPSDSGFRRVGHSTEPGGVRCSPAGAVLCARDVGPPARASCAMAHGPRMAVEKAGAGRGAATAALLLLLLAGGGPMPSSRKSPKTAAR